MISALTLLYLLPKVQHYAMKIQTKRGLLDCFSDDPRRADFEKQAFACCQHPFIINLDYAFQTDSLAIMVLGLAVSKRSCRINGSF